MWRNTIRFSNKNKKSCHYNILSLTRTKKLHMIPREIRNFSLYTASLFSLVSTPSGPSSSEEPEVCWLPHFSISCFSLPLTSSCSVKGVFSSSSWSSFEFPFRLYSPVLTPMVLHVSADKWTTGSTLFWGFFYVDIQFCLSLNLKTFILNINNYAKYYYFKCNIYLACMIHLHPYPHPNPPHIKQKSNKQIKTKQNENKIISFKFWPQPI